MLAESAIITEKSKKMIGLYVYQALLRRNERDKSSPEEISQAKCKMMDEAR